MASKISALNVLVRWEDQDSESDDGRDLAGEEDEVHAFDGPSLSVTVDAEEDANAGKLALLIIVKSASL